MRLQKLILMLSSDNDGEIVAAARAIGKELKSQGMDWHGLAARLSIDAKPAATPFANNESGKIKEHDFHMVTVCMANRDKIKSVKERAFILDMTNRIKDHGPSTFVTTRQRAWLEAIYAKVMAQ